MSHEPPGKWLPVTPARAMVLEVLHHARKVPSLPLSKTIQLGDLVEVRRASRISWSAVFLKAYGLLSRQVPALRRSYLPWPRAHFYEHPESKAVILVEREHQGESIILGARIGAPESTPLAALEDRLRYFREAPILDVNFFRQALRLGKLHWLLRRFVFSHSLYLSGYWRAKRFGTFMISSLGNLGVEQHHPMTFLSTYFTYGPISPEGEVTAKIIYDHRVMDGRVVARCLGELETILQGAIKTELLQGLESKRPRIHVPSDAMVDPLFSAPNQIRLTREAGRDLNVDEAEAA